MARRRKGNCSAFSLNDVREIHVGELITVALATEQSLRMIIDNESGESTFVLLLLNMEDYDRWNNHSLEQKKP
jgi:hypothetical protein